MTEKVFDIIEYMNERDKAGDFEYFKNSIITDTPEVRNVYHRDDNGLTLNEITEQQLRDSIQQLDANFPFWEPEKLVFPDLAPGRAIVFAGHPLDHLPLTIDRELFTSCWNMGVDIHAPRQVRITVPGSDIACLNEALMRLPKAGRAADKKLVATGFAIQSLYPIRKKPISIRNKWKESTSKNFVRFLRQLSRGAKQHKIRKYLRKN